MCEREAIAVLLLCLITLGKNQIRSNLMKCLLLFLVRGCKVIFHKTI